MPSPDWYHQQVVDLFAGKFGDDVYTSVVLRGPKRRELLSLEAYLGLYTDDVRFFNITGSKLDMREAIQRLRSCEMSPSDVKAQYTQMITREGADPEVADALLWRFAESKTAKLNLPLAICSFMTTLQGGRKIVLWYPKTVPGEWILAKFKDNAG